MEHEESNLLDRIIAKLTEIRETRGNLPVWIQEESGHYPFGPSRIDVGQIRRRPGGSLETVVWIDGE